MSALTIYPDDQPQHGVLYTNFLDIQQQLQTLGVRFEQWESAFELTPEADQATVLEAYADSIALLKSEYAFQSVDVMKLKADHPDKTAIRQKFLAEHIHDDFEVRFFVEGQGLFYLHVADKVYVVLCQQGDLISVPANTPHWFDMGENPKFTCIRLFTTPDGWVANFTGNSIASVFPTLDQYVAALS